ncbi:hypothetical protein HY570_02660 [Candidatus Micrarchaeota archaeon]|nr:hypothetical protein [Candidatus Micrarchaeota archaeon]
MVKIIKVSNTLVLPLNFEAYKKLDLSEGEEVEFFELKPGIFIIAKKTKISQIVKAEVEPELQKKAEVPAESKDVKVNDEITEEGINVLKKLNEYKFELRIPEKVNKELSDNERKILTGLIRKGYVTIYKGGKYSKTGVYNIPNKIYDKFYELIKKRKEPAAVLTPIESLQKLGHAVLENESVAKEISVQLEKRIRQGEILGVRGFDGKFYIVTRAHYLTNSEMIQGILRRGDKKTSEIAKSLSINETDCMALLKIMNEKGEIIEKRKDLYTLA